ncbi:Hypothetical protein NTJ_13032 [Nesidiocoris tenuis]|uniref:Uncharacterized protein n=1 Tax=Nesidiocoris tenuis TaxID=355587 RepID=A0ABN7BAI6_9HEMI|nr:Hypothetical protein NTJ_13032 [Nesidiocoris tenuis]
MNNSPVLARSLNEKLALGIESGGKGKNFQLRSRGVPSVDIFMKGFNARYGAEGKQLILYIFVDALFAEKAEEHSLFTEDVPSAAQILLVHSGYR